MKFSLKDLMWSMAFASLGMTALALLVTELSNPPTMTTGTYIVPLSILPGPLFGVAIGKLLHKVLDCILLGLASEFVLLALVAFLTRWN